MTRAKLSAIRCNSSRICPSSNRTELIVDFSDEWHFLEVFRDDPPQVVATKLRGLAHEIEKKYLKEPNND